MKAEREIKSIFVILLALVLIFCYTTVVFADEELTSIEEVESIALDNGLKVDLTEFEDADILFYGVKNNDNSISITQDAKASNRAIFVGSLTKDSWSGSTIGFTISVTATGTQLRAHAGTISMYRVTSGGGVGSLYNSMTFCMTSSTPKSKLSDSYSMNTGSLNSIYLGLSNLTVTDSNWDVTAMSTPSKTKFTK